MEQYTFEAYGVIFEDEFGTMSRAMQTANKTLLHHNPAAKLELLTSGNGKKGITLTKDITINGLTQNQVDMLDKLWSLGNCEALYEYTTSLSKAQRQQAATLMELMRLEYLDTAIDNGETPWIQ